MNPDTSVIIPVYNEEHAVRPVIQQLSKHFKNIVCVDDGSQDNSAAVIAKTAAQLVKHPINLGQGAALQTGIDFALQDSAIKYFITFDADGQHRVEDALKLLHYARKHPVDIVLGSRFLGNASNVSFVKKTFLQLAVLFSNATSGLKLTDAHNGLRVLNRTAAEKLRITMPDMAHASEIINKIAKQKLRYAELPVTIKYNAYSKAHGQSMLNSVNITFDLLVNKVSKK
jgi:polyprenyl-phospho-N-acetylgalactosaminyl synthase